MSPLRTLLLAVCLAGTGPAVAGDLFGGTSDDFLPVDEAFRPAVTRAGDGGLTVAWEIAPEYYLYRHAFEFELVEAGGAELGAPALPDGEKHEDEFFGEVETYRGRVAANLSLEGHAPGQRVELTARIQGCADVGVCYPPHRQQVVVTMPDPGPATSPASPSAGKDDFASRIGLSGNSEPDGGALPVDQAFAFEAIALGPEEIGVRFQIAEGYYLYRDKFDFELAGADGTAIAGWSLPPGEPQVDEHFGEVRVFYDQLEFPLGLDRDDPGVSSLTPVGRFQGCKEAGICYPPTERRVQVELPETTDEVLAASTTGGDAPAATAAASTRPAAPVSEQDRLATTLLTGNIALSMALFFGVGLLLAFTPCVFPMVPILAGILTGQGDRLTTPRAFTLSLIYVLAMALTYTAAGVIAGMFGQNLQAVFQQPWILISFSGVFVLLALSMFGFYELQLPARWQSRLTEYSNRQEGGTFAGVALMGLLSALIVGPCVAPPLAAAFIVIGQQGDPVLGGTALFALSLGMGAPLLVLGASAGRLLPKAGPWMDAVKRVFGVLLLALAIWMLERIIPAVATMALWGALFIVTAIYLGALDRVPETASGWRRLWKGLGVLLLVAGAIELIGAAGGGRDWTQPLRGVAGVTNQQQAPDFRPVSSVAELDAALARASARNQPVLLEFYADWCVDCKRMERSTYPDPAVREALSDVLLLKADVTENSTEDQALLQRFGLYGPPATLFFSRDGRELQPYRVIGFMGAGEFADHVDSALRATGTAGESSRP
jgi:thiol:disulfide interchange protein DsbD